MIYIYVWINNIIYLLKNNEKYSNYLLEKFFNWVTDYELPKDFWSRPHLMNSGFKDSKTPLQMMLIYFQ